jgi:hypothetical protein
VRRLVELGSKRERVPDDVTDLLLDQGQEAVVAAAAPAGREGELVDPVVRVEVLEDVAVVEEGDQRA